VGGPCRGPLHPHKDDAPAAVLKLGLIACCSELAALALLRQAAQLKSGLMPARPLVLLVAQFA
jgi:hypothetical protein